MNLKDLTKSIDSHVSCIVIFIEYPHIKTKAFHFVVFILCSEVVPVDLAAVSVGKQ